MAEAEKSVVLVTCSMARDRDLFDLLARTVDDLVDPAIRHVVVVPGKDLGAFAPYANARRTILAQEAVLPFRTFKFPAFPRLARILKPLRRPIYVDRRLRMIRGWILQQAIKIEMGMAAGADVVVHVDSDVFFIRPMGPGNVIRDGKAPFFRATGATGNPHHLSWVHAAERMLGLPLSADYGSHYIENCVPWHRDAVRAMTQQMEAAHGRAWHDVLLDEKALSEYYIYGLFLDRLRGTEGFYTDKADLCRSYWHEDDGALDEDWLFGGLEAHHYALSVQSTNSLSAQQRDALSRKARALAGG